MALDLPEDSQVVIDRMFADLAVALPGSTPALRNSLIKGITVAVGNRNFDFYIDLEDLLRESNPGTAIFTLPTWANTKGVTRLTGDEAIGVLRISGASDTGIIPIGTTWSAVNGREYISTSEGIMANSFTAIESLTKIPATTNANVVFEDVHGFVSGETIVIITPTDADWIDSYKNIQVVDDLTVLISGVDPAAADETSSPAQAVTFATDVNVEAIEVGVDGDLDAGGIVTLNAQVETATDISSTSKSALGVSGGVDQEAFEDFRDRYLEEVRNPVAHFNESDITREAKTINGVTRVFVNPNTPAVGQCEVFFMRDNDADPIPSASEVSAVDTVVQAIRPAVTIEADVAVAAPTPDFIDFVFTTLTPNTLTMQTAVTANLKQFFAEGTAVGVDVSEDGYRAAITTTIDPDTGDAVTDFAFSSPPSGDQTIAAGDIGQLGTVAYP